MDDKEIGRVWAKYYPKSEDNGDALQMCGTICRVLQAKTRLAITVGMADRLKLQPVLDACGISKAEFDDIEKGLIKI
jgi:hypothetical protein